jgi:hypothetical protein
LIDSGRLHLADAAAAAGAAAAVVAVLLAPVSLPLAAAVLRQYWQLQQPRTCVYLEHSHAEYN